MRRDRNRLALVAGCTCTEGLEKGFDLPLTGLGAMVAILRACWYSQPVCARGRAAAPRCHRDRRRATIRTPCGGAVELTDYF